LKYTVGVLVEVERPRQLVLQLELAVVVDM
jgi:hypothetical protein